MTTIQIAGQELPSEVCGRCGLKLFPAAAMKAHLERHRVLDVGVGRVAYLKRRGRPPGRTVGVKTTKRMGAIVKKDAPGIKIGKNGKNG